MYSSSKLLFRKALFIIQHYKSFPHVHVPFQLILPAPPPKRNLCPQRFILPVLDLRRNGVICIVCTLVHLASFPQQYVVGFIGSFFLFCCCVIFFCVTIPQFTSSTVDRHLSCFQFGTMMNRFAMSFL